MNRTLFCMADGNDGAWEAICVDLDIAVQGESFDEVRRLLTEAIQTYFEDAAKEDEATRTRLLNRRAPFFARLAYASRLAGHAVRTVTSHRKRGGLRASFEIPCHA